MTNEPLEKAWRNGWQRPDRRPIYEWAHDHVTLPPSYAQPGRFDVGSSRHLVKPFDAIQSDGVREVTCAGAIQTGKTLLVEISTMWAACNSPGPIMWTLQTDDDAKQHCNERYMEAMKSVPQIRNMLPQDRHMATSTKVYFGPFYIVVNGANITNLQRVSIRWKFNSEVWLWKQGLLGHARGRVSAFERSGNSKVVNESQGGNDGDDFDLAWKAGNQQLWGVRCFGCGALSPLQFEGRNMTDPTRRACVIWNEDARRADGSWNIGRAAETARWACPQCGHEHDDTSKTRAKWNHDGDYVVMRPDAPATHASFRWEALVSRPMGALVSQFLEARKQQKQGVIQAMQDFTRQRRAISWKDEETKESVTLQTSEYLLTAPTITDKIDNEAKRFMTIDRQRDHFWALVRAWRADGTSRLLFRGRINTSEQLEDVRRRFDVEPQLTFEDAGYFPQGVYTDCAKWGWTALKGSGDDFFTIEVRGKKIKRMWSNAVKVLHDNKLVNLFHWCSDPIKDVLLVLRNGKGAKWEVASDAGEEYENQLNGDHKKERINNKTGRQEWRWTRRHANHMHDLEAMQVAAALMLGILVAPEPAKDDMGEEKTTT